MKKIYLSASFALVISIFLSSCNDEGKGDEVFFHQFNTSVKFESSVGTNVVDSLNLVQLGNTLEDSGMLYDLKNGDIIRARCIRESDGAEIEFSRRNAYYNSAWINPLPYAFGEGRYDASKDGTLLAFGWTDPHIFSPEKAPKKEYDQAYTIYFKSPKIFGDDKERTIKWYTHVHRNISNVYKCEVNGVDFDFKSRSYGRYNENNKWSAISEFVIPVPVNL